MEFVADADSVTRYATLDQRPKRRNDFSGWSAPSALIPIETERSNQIGPDKLQ